MRIGLGIDIHPFAEGRRLVLCGVEIPSRRGLAGHSDGDAALHALMDALLGAACLGDIGELFPPTPQWKDACSLDLLAIVWSKVQAAGFHLVNADLVLLLEEPRIAPHREAMCRALRNAIPNAAFNVKASTTERLGFLGREEGVAALVTVLLEEDR
ncbi:MAG: 2-C-methyl-D-erythritol 2,4-cyclodiphosphate synthase [bacterium]